MFPLRIEMDKTMSAVTHIEFVDNCVDLTNKMWVFLFGADVFSQYVVSLWQILEYKHLTN